MSDLAKARTLSLQSIFHPSDFSRASEVAFAHVLKLALAAKAKMSLLHVTSGAGEVSWTNFPGVRRTLERWGILPEGSSKDAVAGIGLRVRKSVLRPADPVQSVLHYLEEHPTDLIVLATRQHEGRVLWLHKAVARPIARGSRHMTLFVPHGVEGFVSLKDGALSLKRILIPVDKSPQPQCAIDAASVLASSLGCTEVSFALVYIGHQGNLPTVRVSEQEGWQWERTVLQGDVVEKILQASIERPTDLIVMTTEGRHGLLDALGGSTTERVLRGARCPLLAIPAG